VRGRAAQISMPRVRFRYRHHHFGSPTGPHSQIVLPNPTSHGTPHSRRVRLAATARPPQRGRRRRRWSSRGARAAPARARWGGLLARRARARRARAVPRTRAREQRSQAPLRAHTRAVGGWREESTCAAVGVARRERDVERQPRGGRHPRGARLYHLPGTERLPEQAASSRSEARRGQRFSGVAADGRGAPGRSAGQSRKAARGPRRVSVAGGARGPAVRVRTVNIAQLR